MDNASDTARKEYLQFLARVAAAKAKKNERNPTRTAKRKTITTMDVATGKLKIIPPDEVLRRLLEREPE